MVDREEDEELCEFCDSPLEDCDCEDDDDEDD